MSIRERIIHALGGNSEPIRITYYSVFDNPSSITQSADVGNGGSVTISATGLTSDDVTLLRELLYEPLRMEFFRLMGYGFDFEGTVRQRLLVEQSSHAIEVVLVLNQKAATQPDGITRDDAEHALEHFLKNVHGVIIMSGHKRSTPGDALRVVFRSETPGGMADDDPVRALMGLLLGGLPYSQSAETPDADPSDYPDDGRPTQYL